MFDLTSIPFEQLPAFKALSPDALALLPKGGSLADALKILPKKQLAHEAIPILADAMPEREAVWWASQSCERAGDSLAPADLAAAKAAAAWVSSPSPETAAAAAAAAQEAGFKGPGAFAAQAASFAQDPPVLAAGDPVGMSLANQTAAGAVRLAALSDAGLLPTFVPELAGVGAAAATAATAIAAGGGSGGDGDQATAGEPPPEDEPVSRKQRKQASKASAPYLKLGQDIATGKNHW